MCILPYILCTLVCTYCAHWCVHFVHTVKYHFFSVHKMFSSFFQCSPGMYEHTGAHRAHVCTGKLADAYMCIYVKSIYIHIWISNSHTGTYELAGSLMGGPACPSLPLAAAMIATEISMLGVAGVVTAGLAVQRRAPPAITRRRPGSAAADSTRPWHCPVAVHRTRKVSEGE